MTVRISSSPSRMLPETPGPDQVAQEPLLTERLLDARVQMLGQALDDVTALVDRLECFGSCGRR